MADDNYVITEGFNRLSNQMNGISNQLSQVQNTLEIHGNAIQKVSSTAAANEKSIKSMREANKKIQATNNFLLQAKLNDRMEITGLNSRFFKTPLDLRTAVWKLLREDLKLQLEFSEILEAYTKIRKIKEINETAVVVIFVHEAVKNRVMIQKAKLSNDEARKIFFNDVLTKFNRNLIFQARKMMKDGKFAKVGTLNGKIFIRKEEKGQKIFINSICEMEDLACRGVEMNRDGMDQN